MNILATDHDPAGAEAGVVDINNQQKRSNKMENENKDQEFDDVQVEDPFEAIESLKTEISDLKAEVARLLDEVDKERATVTVLAESVHGYKVIAEKEKKAMKKASEAMEKLVKEVEPAMKTVSAKVDAVGVQFVNSLSEIRKVCASSEKKAEAMINNKISAFDGRIAKVDVELEKHLQWHEARKRR